MEVIGAETTAVLWVRWWASKDMGCARTKRKKWPIIDHERQKVSLILTLYFSRFNFPKLIQLSGIILKKLLIPET
jgi:hypothetical protein